ncbi:MAG: 2-isopropylmalate synthase, partial [Chloroflexi bacterium]|nr:2-isopropylmalate synthase [Chloroflexota bacterium]
MDKGRVLIFDTTLRDGEQSAGTAMTADEKLEIAKQLERLGVDVIEAGFPISSPGDFLAVQTIAREVRKPTIAALAHASIAAVDRAAEALKDAAHARIHIFLSSSDVHLLHQLRKDREEVMGMAVAAITRAKQHTDDVEFSPMDATRTEPEYLIQMVKAAIEAGATTINIPDTVGYAVPSEFAELITRLYKEVPEFSDSVRMSVHCHDDLGMAVSNSLAAVKAGARQVEGCINGIGERAGNCALEEVIMALRTRSDYFGADTGVDTTQLLPTS